MIKAGFAKCGKECKVKTPEGKKSSLLSVALVVQQHKNEVLDKKAAKEQYVKEPEKKQSTKTMKTPKKQW